MRQWNGLFRKEWVTMKGLLFVNALFAVATMSFLPMVITRFWGAGLSVFEFALIICFLWAIASMFAPVIALFTTLEREMKRPDVWLHSNVSIFQLVGSKAVFAILIGAGGLLIPAIVLAVHYVILTPSILTLNALWFYGRTLIVIFFVTSISILCVGFFFWVLYRLMEPYLRGFSIPVTSILFFVSMWAVERLGNTDVYNKVVKVGPIDLMQLKRPQLDIGIDYFEVTGTIFYTGQIIFEVLLTVIMFIVAIVLFEKKVRL